MRNQRNQYSEIVKSRISLILLFLKTDFADFAHSTALDPYFRWFYCFWLLITLLFAVSDSELRRLCWFYRCWSMTSPILLFLKIDFADFTHSRPTAPDCGFRWIRFSRSWSLIWLSCRSKDRWNQRNSNQPSKVVKIAKVAIKNSQINQISNQGAVESAKSAIRSGRMSELSEITLQK